MSKRKLLWLVMLTVALFTTVLAVASIRNRPDSRTVKPPLVSLRQNPIVAPTATGQAYVRSAQISPMLRWHLKMLGDRIQKPGKERITIVGTIKRAGDSQALPMSLTLEFPDRLRLMIHDGIQERVVTFNGQTAASVANALTSSEREIIESLVYDSAEHFLLSQTNGFAMRCLGQRFRADDGTTPNYTGPYYDLYEVSDEIKTAADARQQVKDYYFNSDTLLLERVRYQIARSGMPVEIETRLSNWQQAQGQQMPRRILRLENGQLVMALTITSMAISPGVNDGSFGQQ